MNTNPEQPDLETLSAISREHEAEMRREAEVARMLDKQPGNANAANTLPKLVLALCVVVPIVLWTVRVVAAASGGRDGAFIHRMM